MTNEQWEKIKSLPALEILIQLSICFGNTPGAKLGDYNIKDLKKIFEDLNCEHIDNLP